MQSISINGPNTTGPTDNIEKKPKKSKTICAIFKRKIGQFLSALKSVLFFWKNGPFSSRQKRQITKLKKYRDLNQRKVCSKSKDAISLEKAKKKAASEPRKSSQITKDASLQELHKTARDFSKKLVATLYTEKLEESVNELQGQNKSVASAIKGSIQFLFSMSGGNGKLAKQLQGSPADIAPSIAKQQLMNWLKGEKFSEEKPTLKKAILDSLAEKAPTVKDSPKQKDKGFSFFARDKKAEQAPQTKEQEVDQLLERLEKGTLTTLPEGENSAEIFDKAIDELIKKRLEGHQELIDKTLGDNLPELTQSFLQTNAAIITDHIAEQLIQRIETIPSFKELFEEVVTHSWAHTKAIEMAQKKRKEQKKNLSAARQNPEHALSKQLLETVDSFPGVSNAEKEKAFLDQQYRETFSAHAVGEKSITDSCDALIKLLIDPDTRASQSETRRSLFAFTTNIPEEEITPEERLYKGLALSIFGILFPKRREGGKTISGLRDIPLFKPKEAEEIIEKTDEVIQAIMPKKTKEFLKKAKEYRSTVENGLLFMVEDQIIDSMEKGIKKTVDLIADPAQIEELVGETVLPTVNETMIEVFIRSVFNDSENLKTKTHWFAKNEKQIASMILEVHKDPAKKEKAIGEISEKVFDRAYIEISNDLEKLITRKTVEKVCREMIENYLKQLTEGNVKPTEKALLDFIKKEGAESVKEDTTLYADLIQTLLVDIGEFDGSFLSTALSSANPSILREINPIREGHAYIVEKSVDAARKKFIEDDRAIRELLDLEVDTIEKTDEQRKRKLEEEIEKTARIAHFLISRIAAKSSYGALAKWGAQKFTIGTDHRKLERVITKALDKLFKDEMINKSLILSIEDIVHKHLVEEFAN